MTDATPSERRISAITETFWNLLRDCPPVEAVAGLEIVLARAREWEGMGELALSDEPTPHLRALMAGNSLDERAAAIAHAQDFTREKTLRQAAEIARHGKVIESAYGRHPSIHGNQIADAILASIPAHAPPQRAQTITAEEVRIALHRACSWQPVGAGDGGTYIVSTPNMNTMRAALEEFTSRRIDALRARAGEG